MARPLNPKRDFHVDQRDVLRIVRVIAESDFCTNEEKIAAHEAGETLTSILSEAFKRSVTQKKTALTHIFRR